MQNPVVNAHMVQVMAPNPISHGGPTFGECLLPMGRPLRSQGQPICPRGNPSAPGANLKPLRGAPYDPPPTARTLGFGRISTCPFPRGSSQPLLLDETCSSPSFKPGIRPWRKRLGRILGLGPGVEQFSATCKTCSTQAETPESRRNLPWQKSARPPGRASWTSTAS